MTHFRSLAILFSLILVSTLSHAQLPQIAKKALPAVRQAGSTVAHGTIVNSVGQAVTHAAAKPVQTPSMHTPSVPVLSTQKVAYPSASPAKVSSSSVRTKFNISSDQSVYIGKSDRRVWQKFRAQLDALGSVMPDPNPDRVSSYARNNLSKEQLTELTQQYEQVVQDIQNATANVIPYVVANSLPGEGHTLQSHTRNFVTTTTSDTLAKIGKLRKELPYEPYLKAQYEYWGTVMEGFNPLLKGKFVKQKEVMARTDSRVVETHEFELMNPDKTDYVLPQSKTLIVDPDDDDEIDSWAAVRERQNNPPISAEDAAKEAERLLPTLPSNMRIAFINDDLLPRINFEAWGKKGLLGRNAQVEIFSEGYSFMDQVQRGVHYDLVITDIMVKGGGEAMMPELRDINADTPVIAATKYERFEIDPNKLFNEGFDGYLWYSSAFNESYGYVEYLRAMSNYYYYKNLHGWQR